MGLKKRYWLLMVVAVLLIGAVITVKAGWLTPSFADYSASAQWQQQQFQNERLPSADEVPDSTVQAWWNMLTNKAEDSAPVSPPPIATLSPQTLQQTPDNSLYRLGHSTLLLKITGQWWLIDPMFSERASPVQFFGPKRFHEVPVGIDDLPPIDGVIISHDHYDHLDYDSIKHLAPKVKQFLTPLGVGDRLIDWGVAADKVQQMDWWDSFASEGLTITATPSQHFSGRTLSDSNQTLWASWAFNSSDFAVYFSGDSGYFDGFKDIGERLGPFDVALMEAGAYNPMWPYVHMFPEETVKAHQDVNANWLIPIHNGTFDLSTHPWTKPFEEVLGHAKKYGVNVSTPKMGEAFTMGNANNGSAWWRE